jgi:molybdopterin/thiamine biosynthesis adenylyltransferase
MNVLTIIEPLLRRALQEGERRPRPPVRCPMGRCVSGATVEYFVRPPAAEDAPTLLLVPQGDMAAPPELPADCLGWLVIGRARDRGRARGVLRIGSVERPIERLKIVGPGMEVVRLNGAESWPRDRPDAHERWSRTIGALGEDVWRRLTGLAYAIVGVGRTGSALAEAMAAGWGIERLALIDPDVIRPHNLGEMVGVQPADLGRSKVEAVAERLRGIGDPSLSLTTVAESITHRDALDAVRGCDVLIGCLDHDAGRWATAALASLYCRTHLDIATGIHGHGDARRMGADVRLTLPGDRCLECLGGLADPAGAHRALATPAAEWSALTARDWRAERAGSLRSLNGLAAAVAQRLWEDLIAARVRASTWLRIEYDAAGRPSITEPTPPRPVACRLCDLMGRADDGLPRAAALARGDVE